ncbi:MAG TPA: M28 family metallopeptidase [Candidatus Aminicenantes bacterium]|nr:M28 family metallopeptidase [Candidatus Aminicenantes bacterium]HRY65852.1 M28 family metallopeptidase [Candidatus Aminicenantes bacterium]HRZ72822.1 M28 family metallopeptidase [Candidatus Aminicenantes bacterium]
MRYRTGTLAALAALLTVAGWGAQKASFDAGQALDHIKVLAADELQGRMSGQPGYRTAADYAVARFKDWGLEPGGPSDGFFQDLTFLFEQARPGAVFQVMSGRTALSFHYDYEWAANRGSGSGTFAAGIVFAGYGLSDAAAGYDDYAGLDVNGKLVLACGDSLPELADKLGRPITARERILAALAHGARGIILFRSGAGAGDVSPYLYRGLGPDAYKADFVILNVQKSVVDFIFKHERTELRYHLGRIQQTLQPSSLALAAQGFVRLEMIRDEKRPTMNVLARIPGADKALKDEVVILGAHLDHLGVDMSGDVFNGADDNASGAAVVLEAARVLRANGFRPRRTVVFALWGAEEFGLLGSEHYAAHPVYPLEKTAAYVNLDMEGHGNGRVLFEGAYYAPRLWRSVEAGLAAGPALSLQPARGGSGGSDHYPFMTRGVPTAFIGTDGYHFKTNRVGDVFELIAPDVLRSAGEAVVRTIEILASDGTLRLEGTLAERRADYQWKAAQVVNLAAEPLGGLIERRREAQDPDVDVQLAFVDEARSGGPDGAGILTELVAARQAIRASRGLRLYEEKPVYEFQFEAGLNPGRTAVLAGVRGLARIAAEPAWAEVLSRQGVSFASIEPGLFEGDGLAPRGAAAVAAAGRARLLLIARGLSPARTRSLLEACVKPALIVTPDRPGPGLVELLKKTRSTVGLVLGRGADLQAYVQAFDELARALGRTRVLAVTEDDVWSGAGAGRARQVIAALVRAGRPDADIAGFAGGNFADILARVRPE